MKFAKQEFDIENNEYSFEIDDDFNQMKINLWMAIDEYNKLNHKEIFEIVQIIYNESINNKGSEIKELGFIIDDKNIYTTFCIDPETTLNIDKINVLTNSEFKTFLNIIEQKKAFLN